MGKNIQSIQTFVVDGIEYSWQYRHGWSVNYGAENRGVSASVWLHFERTRELIVDFPFSTFGMADPPKKSNLVQQLTAAVPSALSAGWDPESRGKPFRFSVAEGT